MPILVFNEGRRTKASIYHDLWTKVKLEANGNQSAIYNNEQFGHCLNVSKGQTDMGLSSLLHIMSLVIL